MHLLWNYWLHSCQLEKTLLNICIALACSLGYIEALHWMSGLADASTEPLWLVGYCLHLQSTLIQCDCMHVIVGLMGSMGSSIVGL